MGRAFFILGLALVMLSQALLMAGCATQASVDCADTMDAWECYADRGN